MDQQESLKVLDMARKDWEKYRTDGVLEMVMDDGREAFGLFVQSRYYQIILYVIIGQRCGLTEQCTVIDTRVKKSDVDHLVVYSSQRFDILPKTFLASPPKEVLKRKKKGGLSFKSAVREWLGGELVSLCQSPEKCEKAINNLKFHTDEQTQGGISIPTVRYTSKRT